MRRLSLAALFLAGCASSDPAVRPSAAPADAELAALRTSMTEMLERMDVLNDRIARLESDLAAATAPPPRRAAETSPPAESRPAAVQTVQPQRAVVGAGIAENYRDAIVLFSQGRLPQARSAFQQVFDTDPAGELADNALFWIGETWFAANDFANAMTFYRRVSEEYGDQNKAPDALYKLALAHEKTGDLALARKAFEQVIARYPYSSPAASAKAELKRIRY